MVKFDANDSKKMKEDKLLAASGGSTLALSSIAAFVGLCCVGPLAVGLFGVSGAVLLARLEPARPFILAFAAILMLYSGYLVYVRPMLNREGVGGTLSQQAIFWVSLCLVLLAAFADQIFWVLT